MENKLIYRHVILPALAPMAFLIIAATPIEAIGCFNRGLWAVLVALGSLLVALALMSKTLTLRLRGQGATGWSVLSAVILSLPAIFLLILA